MLYPFMSVLSLCLLPFVLNILGIDFSSSTHLNTPTHSPDDSVSALKSVQGSLHHVILEWSAVTTAVLAALLCIFHYIVRRDISIPIMGAALFSAGMLDAFHTLAATQLIEASADSAEFIPFTWALSRVFNSSIMLIGVCIGVSLHQRVNPLDPRASNTRSLSHDILLFSLISIFFIALAYFTVHTAANSSHLPATMYPNALISRPYDVVPLAIFLLAGSLCWVWFRQYKSTVRFALLLSFIPEVMAQLHMAFGSVLLFDNHFNIAHGLKTLAYSCVFFGVVTDLVRRQPKLSKPKFVEARPAKLLDEMLVIGKASRPLAFRLPIAAFTLSLIVAFIVSLTYYFEGKQLIKQQEITQLESESLLFEPYFATLFRNTTSDALFLSRAPEVHSMLSSIQSSDQEKFDVYKFNLTQLFTQMLATNPNYTKIRFIGYEGLGKEIINVRKVNDQIIVIPSAELQNKGHKGYYTEALKLQTGDVHFSKFNLNREFGKVSLPHQPVLRVSTPVYYPGSSSVFGAVVVTIDFLKYIKPLTDNTLASLHFSLSNDEGHYVYHPDKTKTYGFDLGHSESLFKDYPDLINLPEKGKLVTTTINSQHFEVPALYRVLNLTKHGAQQDLLLLLYHTNNAGFEALQSLQKRSVLLSISVAVFALAISILGARKIAGPLIRLANSLSKYTPGSQFSAPETQQKDEIGVLARSFHNLLIEMEASRVAEQYSAQKAKEASAQLTAVFNSAADAIITIDAKGMILSFNKAATEMFGYAETEAVNQNIKVLIPEHFALHHDSYLSEYLRTGKSGILGVGRELTGQKKSGEAFPIHLSLSQTDTHQGVIFIGVIRDFTLNKRAEQALINAKEQAEQAAALKSQFVASMSHEIRTPMNGVLGMLELLQDTPLNEKQNHYTSIANNSAKSLLQIINDILDFSKIEAGKMDVDVIDFNLSQLLEEVAQGNAFKAERKGLELILDIGQIEHSMVKGDPGRLRQILNNLINNAIKFTHEGEVVIHAALKTSKTNLTLVCEITDSGIGIGEDEQAKLFDAFTQVDASTTRKYGGTGLGLAIVKQLCELLGGNISVESKVNKGSTFSFDIQLEHSSLPDIELNHLDLTDLPILVVDDNAVNRMVLSGQLTRWGAKVTEANSAAQAWDILATNNTFKAAIVDMQMPDTDGAEFGTRVRAQDQFNDMHLIMMTSMGNRGDAKRFADIGFSAYFPKPTRSQDLFDALSLVLMNNSDSQNTPFITQHLVHDLRSNKQQKALNNTSNLEGKTILLVEDNKVNQVVASTMLKKLGVEYQIAENGLVAIEMLSDTAFDLILMDCQMPEMDGYEATTAIRENKAGHDKISYSYCCNDGQRYERRQRKMPGYRNERLPQ